MTSKFMKENNRSICQMRPVQGESTSSHQTTTDSPVMVPENSWEDITVETEITVSMKNLTVKNCPPYCLQHQGQVGNTDHENTIQKMKPRKNATIISRHKINKPMT